jgi:hypothetical protein
LRSDFVLNERHLRGRLRSYFRYYHASRTHLALNKDAPEPRAVEPVLATNVIRADGVRLDA